MASYQKLQSDKNLEEVDTITRDKLAQLLSSNRREQRTQS